MLKLGTVYIIGTHKLYVTQSKMWDLVDTIHVKKADLFKAYQFPSVVFLVDTTKLVPVH